MASGRILLFTIKIENDIQKFRMEGDSLNNKATLYEFLFNKDKYTGTKKILSLLFIILATIFRLYGPPKLISELMIEVIIILFLSFFIAKIFFYNKKKQLKTSMMDKILIFCFILLVVFNTLSMLNNN